MRNRADRFKTKSKPPSNNWKPFNAQWKNPQHDSNAMDTSPGRTCTRIAEAEEDFLPGGTRYEQHVGGSREGGILQGPVQKDGTRKVLTCFFCRKPGHFTRDCRQKRYGNQGPSHTRQTHEEEVVATRCIANERTPQQRATDWLLGVANKDDSVKDIVMQELWKKEDFQNA
jgi:hypothetical protein